MIEASHSSQCYIVLKYIGTIACFFKLATVSASVVRKLYAKAKNIYDSNFHWKNLGKWAVVTGGTDGIGKAYAHELASKGFNICLISRNPEKVVSVAEELEKKYGISTKTINCDFTHGPEVYKVISEKLEELDDGIGVLVNNVGMSYTHAEYFHAIPNGLKVFQDMINSNAASCTMMMKLVLPQMEQRRKGIIINISSLMALYPMPLLCVYAACKAYVDYLSRAAQYEYKSKGIIIQSVLPGYVATKMSNRRTSLEVPSAETYVSKAIQTVGNEDCTYGYFPHKVRGFVHEWLRASFPTCINMAIAMYYMKKSREGYFRKMKRKGIEDK